MPSPYWNYGYRLPDVVETDARVCYCIKLPDIPEYRQAFLDAVMMLTKWFNWQRDSTHKAAQVARYLNDVLVPQLEKDFMCNYFELRQSPTVPCLVEQRLEPEGPWLPAFRFDECEQSSATDIYIYNQNNQIIQNTIYERWDGTNPSSVNPDTPDTNYDGDGSVQRQAALCMALQSWVGAICTDYVVKAQTALGLTALIPALGSLLGPLGGAAGAIVAAALALASLEGIDAATDGDAINDVICCMNTYLQGKAVTQALWQNSLTGCGFDGGTHQQILRDIVNAELANTKNWTVFLNALGDAWTYAQAGVDDCPCGVVEWEHTFYSAGPRLPEENILYGAYDAANNWLYSTWALDPSHHASSTIWGACQQPFFADVNITRVRMTYQTVVNNPFTARQGNIQSSIHGVLAAINTTNSGTYNVDTGSINIIMTNGSSLSWYYTQRSSGNANDIVRLKSVTINGKGFDPFAPP